MKKVLLLLILLNLFQHLSLAQEQRLVDSLETKLKQLNTEKMELRNNVASKNDTVLTKILISLSNASLGSNPDKAMDYAKQCLALSEQIGHKKGIASAYNNMGNVNGLKANYEAALENFKASLKIKMEIGDKKNIPGSYGNIANIYQAQGNYPEALKNLFASLKMNEQAKDTQFISYNLLHIGEVYRFQGNYNEALKNNYAALKLAQEIKDKMGIACAYNNIGKVYSSENKYADALNTFLTGLKTDEELGDKYLLANTHSNIAEVYNKQGNRPEALKNYSAALKLDEELGDKDGVASFYINIGSIYNKEKKYKEAADNLNKGLAISKEIGSLDGIKECYKELASLYNEQGNYKQSLDYYKLYIANRDSLMNNQNSKKTNALLMNYEFSKKLSADSIKTADEKRLISAELKQERTKSYALYGGLALMVLVAGVFFKQRNKIGKEKKVSEELLLNILPTEVAAELKATGTSKAKTFSMVTVMFTDFKDFTKISERVSGELLVDEIHYCFSAFDNILHKHRIEKIKTIGDAYMCAGGLPVLNYTHATDVVKAAIEIRDFMLNRKKEKEAQGEIPFELRIGIHTGSVVAGIVGVKKFQYDIWGDTVNLAARMESSSEAGKINISGSTYELVKNDFKCIHRGKVEAKHKGEVDMYFVEG